MIKRDKDEQMFAQDETPPDTMGDRAGREVRFPDLHSAGRELAHALGEFKSREDTIVLTPVLGGVPVAHEAAQVLGLPLDFVIIRRLLTPDGADSQVCAFNAAGSLVIDEELPPRPPAPQSPFDHFVADALDALARRERVCRAGRPPVELAGKTILLVDCGIRTGLTLRAAIRALRRKRPERIVAAVPVASPESREVIEAVADSVICLKWPHPFGHVGLWYRDFRRPGEHEISALLT